MVKILKNIGKEYVKYVLQRILECGMTLKRKKCELVKQEIKFLGHLISGDSVNHDPKKVEAIHEYFIAYQ